MGCHASASKLIKGVPMIYKTFSDSLDDAISLLKLSEKSEIASDRDAQLVLRSAVVLSVAFWQNYYESHVEDISKVIMQRCRKSEKLPELIRDKVGNWVVQEKNIKRRPYKTASLVWEFAGGKWRSYYTDYIKHMVSRLNTPNTKNIIALYRSVLGLENIAECWSSRINGKSPSESIDYIFDIRHDSAHGSFNTTLSNEHVQEMIECLRENAKQSYDCASLELDKITESSGTPYSL